MKRANTFIIRMILLAAAMLAGHAAAWPQAGHAGSVTLPNGTATLSQSCAGTFSPDEAVDGNLADSSNGWAIYACPTTSNQTAVWETAVDVHFKQ